ncbi:MAG: YIP1 family protein [Nitrospiraceae bacterium]|nr:YIP1 family protein [Nitrospiraceae bacterium]
MPVILNRALRAAALDPYVYDELSPRGQAMGQAVAIIILSGVAAGIGDARSGGIAAFLIGTVAALAGWFLWTLVAYFAGTRMFPGRRTTSGYVRMLTFAGFASAPGLIRVLELLPGLRAPVFLAAAVWMIAATIIGIKQSLRYSSTLKAAGICITAWLVQVGATGAVIYALRAYAGFV